MGFITPSLASHYDRSPLAVLQRGKMEKEPKQTTDGADVDQPGPNRNPWAPLSPVSEEASREEHFRKAREAAIE
jgi:hypothetical protein